MSKLAFAIRSAPTGRRSPIQTSMRSLDAGVNASWNMLPTQVADEFRISVTLGANVVLSQQEQMLAVEGRQALKTNAEREVKRAIIEEVFGEFRPLLRDISLATYERDPERIRAAVGRLEEAMFG